MPKQRRTPARLASKPSTSTPYTYATQAPRLSNPNKNCGVRSTISTSLPQPTTTVLTFERQHKSDSLHRLSAGYALDVTNGFEGVGALLATSAGVNFAVSVRNFMHVALGLESQTMDFYGYDYYGYDTWTEVSSAITLNVGLSF